LPAPTLVIEGGRVSLTPALKRRWVVLTAASLAVCALMAGQLLGRVPAHPAPGLAALILGAILTSGLNGRQFMSRRAALMPPAFVITFLALLLHGPHRDVRRRHARACARSREPRERPAPGRRRQRLHPRLPANRPAGDRHVRRLRVPGAVEPERGGGFPGDLRPDRRGARPHRSARQLGDGAGLPHLRRLAAQAPS
jgi:hypothetical protein